jgi:MFS family permease
MRRKRTAALASARKAGTREGLPALRVLAPLYGAGFTTAFGAHSIAAGLGVEGQSLGLSLLTFGILLAVYDIAEVILKPVFGSLSDRIGIKPVIVGGLIAFSAASLVGVFAAGPLMLAIARLGQGAAASAFSPASSAAVARLAGPAAAGRYFGRYGSWKGVGYVLGPLLGAVLIGVGGFPALFITLALCSAAAAVWTWAALPALPVLPRPRYTLVDLLRQSTERGFLVPTMVLAGATGSLGVAVGFLPLLGNALELPLVVSMGAVAVLALSSTLTQPLVGKLRDENRLAPRLGMSSALMLIAAGILILALAPLPITLLVAAALMGTGIGIATPLGFAYLAATTPPERMGRTMGTAELGREVGDAAGPLIVGGIASAAGIAAGLGALAVLLAAAAAICFAALRISTTAPEGTEPAG